ncbi:virulence-associated protein VapH [Dichelobacter nodosus VCS1703A]|uniref:Virulence-associated protein VapH n=2 Tax=Dichelobacter nodosus TaxID=870 RepID=A5EWA1_DICNV|nr:virulence-associated protein H [Dichelobacter nodosus]ABQ14187.1 virulence-associated protein VapH [Dichelobacter nodosus VCS1703A]
MKTYLLTSQELLAYSPLATVSCSRDWNPVDTKACTALIKRIFYAQNLSMLWQHTWENRKVRRFFRSGSSNLAYAVALLFGTNGGSQSKITKGDCECLIHYR